jgi:hypothetical protein
VLSVTIARSNALIRVALKMPAMLAPLECPSIHVRLCPPKGTFDRMA